MAKTMTPSKFATGPQIDKAVANYRALLEKHSGEFDVEAVQTVLGQSELAGEQFAVFRRRVEAVSDMIARMVPNMNPSLTPQQVLDATGRKQYVDHNVVVAMPRAGLLYDPHVYFFKVGRYVSDAELEKEYELRGLKAAAPDIVAQVNTDDASFADEHPNGTHWKDVNDQWCYAAFDRWDDERDVHVDRHDDGWDARWWFAGCRK
jgi:hypothetical protein